ncbi:unnamed protein product [Cunninghamella echinulata]
MNIINLTNKELSFTPYDVKWIPSSNRICSVGATGQSTGKIAIFTLEDKRVTLTAETETGTPIRCCTYGASDIYTRHVATGDFNGNLQIWDTQHFEAPIDTVKAHESIIHSIDGIGGNIYSGGARELITGSRDGIVKVWDTRQIQSSVFTIKTKNNETIKNEVWAVAFEKSQKSQQRLIAMGYDNGVVRLFDLTSGSYIWETNLGDGICSIDFSMDNNQFLYASTLSGAYTIQLSNGDIKKLDLPPDTTNWKINHVQQGSDYFSISSGDGKISIWDQQNVKKPLASSNLTKHPIISLDWHPNKSGLYVCSAFDQTLKIGCIEQLLK